MWSTPYYGKLVDFLFMYSKVIFRGALKKTDEKFLLFDCEIWPWHIVYFSLFTTLVLISAFTVFWASFLINDTSFFDTEYDCFIKDVEKHVYTPLVHYLTTKPYPNAKLCLTESGQCDPNDVGCHEWPHCADFSDEMMCYQFVYNVLAGLLAASGFLTVVVSYIATCCFFLKWLSNCSKEGFFTFLLFHLVIYLPITLSILAMLMISDDFQLTYHDAFHYHAYWFSFVYVGPLTAGCFVSLTKVSDKIFKDVTIGFSLPATTLLLLLISLVLYRQMYYVHTF
jgi:hypothetical protein